MNFFKKLTLTCLISSFAISSLVADYREAESAAKQKIADLEQQKKELLKKQKLNEARPNVLAGIGIILLGSAFVVAANSNMPILQETGLGTGLFASSILYGASFLAPEHATTLKQMACVTPALGMLGQFIHSDLISGQRGLIKCLPLHIDKIAIQHNGRKSGAFLFVSGIGTYLACEPIWKKLRAFVKSNDDQNAE